MALPVRLTEADLETIDFKKKGFTAADPNFYPTITNGEWWEFPFDESRRNTIRCRINGLGFNVETRTGLTNGKMYIRAIKKCQDPNGVQKALDSITGPDATETEAAVTAPAKA